MGEPPLISICIPAYQRADYLKRLLGSIEAQRFRDFEVILTDDSPGEEIQKLAEVHPLKPLIRYYKNKHTLGSPENWNEGLRRARGVWIKPMHDDDWFRDPDSLSAYAHATHNPAVSFIYSAYLNVYEDGKTRIIRNGYYHSALNRNPEILIASNRVGPPSCILFRKDESIIFDNRMKWLVDIDFYIQYLKKYPPAVYIPEALVQIGISPTQVTRSSFGIAEIEIPERFMLLEKMNANCMDNISIFDSWWRFVRNMHIDTEKKITNSGYMGTVPPVIKKIIRVQEKIPAALLNTGAFSKIFMCIQFIRRKKEV